MAFISSWGKKALEFLTGYLIEKSLKCDNLFVFIMLLNFSMFSLNTNTKYFLGIMGALIMRAIFIFAGVAIN